MNVMYEDPVSFGRYEVDELVGSGGFADVFACYHPGLETRVAVKVLHHHLARDKAVCERFLQEAQVLWRADSDRVIQVTHVDQLPDGRPYFVMRFADRGSLDTLIQHRISEFGELFSLRETVGLAVDIVDCLVALKSRNLVHRDLKPMNILIKTIRTPDHERAERFGLPADERIVLGDFGLAKRLREGTNLASQLGGTPAYMAPEQTSLTEHVTWRADLFAVAVIVYELATGVVPWPSRDLSQVRDVDLSGVSIQDFRPDFPARLDDVLHRAMSPDPMDRHDDPMEFAEELLALLGDEREGPRVGSGSVIAVREICSDMAASVRDPEVGSLLGEVEQLLDEPVRIGVIGGNRLSPIPLGLKLVGERPPPGEASLLGSVVVRLTHGEPGLVASLSGGARLDGRWHKDIDGYLHLELPAAPWLIESLELRFPNDDIAGTEIIEVPHAALRRNRSLVQEVYASLDVVVVGVPADRSAELAAIDEVLRLDPTAGPFAAIGVRQLGVSVEPEHPVLLAAVPGDDTIELRMILDEVLHGTRREDCRASLAWHRLLELAADCEALAPFLGRVEEVAAEHPALREVHALRTDLSSSALDVSTRRRLHRLLGRRMAAARLGVVPDAPVELLISHALDEQRAWRRSEEIDPQLAEMVANSLARLEATLRDRLEGGTR